MMKKKSFSPLYVMILCLLLAGSCDVNNSESLENESKLSRGLTEVEKKLIEADQEFSVDIFRQAVANDGKDNTFISPLSISIALGMTMNGARGDTYSEMQQTLAFQDMEINDINEGYKSLIELLTTADSKVQMEIANSVWTRQGFAMTQDFSGALTQYFEAEATELDFSDPNAAVTINEWVAEKTNEKIESIIDKIPSSAVMYLINAVYFNGTWKYEFDPEATDSMIFRQETGEYIRAEMMNQMSKFYFHKGEDVEIIDLPYGDELFTMTLIKPADGTPINEFVSEKFTVEKLNEWYNSLTADSVGLFLPKLELEYDLTLNGLLADMGMPTAFNPSEADFRGINGSGEIFISRVLHKTYLKMDEEGTEAAGVTAVEMGITSVGDGPRFPTISFDSPYIFILREQNSGAILFMGKIKDPTLN